MNARKIGYWVSTGIIAFMIGVGGAMDIARPPEAVEGMAKLGYPAYFMLILGVWKVLGAAAILAPKFPRLKEWAYAGIIFDLTGAAASHGASGDPPQNVAIPLVLCLVTAASWALRPESRVIRADAKSPASPQASAAAEDVPAAAA